MGNGHGVSIILMTGTESTYITTYYLYSSTTKVLYTNTYIKGETTN